MDRLHYWLLSLLFAVPALSLTGCGDDEPTAMQRGTGRAPARAAKKKAAGGGGASAVAGADELPPKLRNVDWSTTGDLARDTRNMRDPFKRYVEDLVVQEPTPGGGGGQGPEGPVEVIAGRFSVDELQLQAIITGTAVHKAMLIDPGKLGHVVRQGDVVGEEAMRVARITRNEVLFKPLTPPADEEEPKEVRKVLLTQEELAELLP